MKHLNPECPVVEIGSGNCPKCNPDKDICAKCGNEYTSYRDGYCQDCEIEEEGKPFAYFDRVLATPKFVAVKKTKSKRVTPYRS